MARFSKGILKVKKHHSPDGVVDVTPARLKHWADQFQAMKARNWHASVHFNHSDDLAEMAPVQLGTDGAIKRGAHNAVGRLADFQLAADGQSAEVVIDLPDEAAAKKARENVVEVSPVIMSKVRDGDGHEYLDAITAVDLVCQPVDNGQTPFVELNHTIACSLRMIDAGGKPQTYRMASDEFPPKAKDGDGDGQTGEGKAEGDPPPVEKENPDLPADDGAKAEAEAIVAHLSQLGVELPAEWSFKADAAGQILLAALKTASRAKSDSHADEETAEDETKSNGDTTVADPGYAAMALKADAAHTYAENMHRRHVKEKLDKLLQEGRCTPAEAKLYGEQLGTIKLSLDASGKQLTQSDVETFIGHREAVPKGTFWTDEVRTRMSTVVEPPETMRADMTSDEIQNLSNWALGGKREPAAK